MLIDIHILEVNNPHSHLCIKFPLPPESDHSSMLSKVTEHAYEMPESFSPALALLLTEVRSVYSFALSH